MVQKVNLSEAFQQVPELWSPRIFAGLNEAYVKLARLHGEFIWHQHETEDELFLVVKGELVILLRDGEVRLKEGEFVVIPRGVEHKPVAAEEVHVVLIEPKSTVNTGSVIDEHTREAKWAAS